MRQPDPSDPRCPECGEPIGLTATYCMHCSTDLTEAREQAEGEADGFWDRRPTTSTAPGGESAATTDSRWLDPDGIADDTLTVAVGIAGGLVIGLIGTVVLLLLTSSAWALLVGLVGWLGATAHLVTRRTVRTAFTRAAYGAAGVLLLVPLIAFAPSNEPTELGARLVLFLLLLGGVTIPVAVVAGIGLMISR